MDSRILRNDTQKKPQDGQFSVSSVYLIMTFLGLAVLLPSQTKANDQDLARANGVIVQFNETRGPASTAPQMQESLGNSAQIVDAVEDLNIALVKDQSQDIEDLIEELEKNENVRRVEPNLSREFAAFIPNDSNFSNQWSHRNTGQSVNGSSGRSGSDIDSTIAWDNDKGSSKSIIVAVIDTGVEYTHPDLAANMWDGSSCVNDFGNTIAGGCPFHGWNYDSNNNNPIDDGQTNSSYTGHGTFAASVVGAVSNNTQGISGFSRNNQLKIMALRFNFDVFSEIKAINFAKFNGAKVINASYGGGGFSQIESDAIAAFPGVVVAASGNGGSDFVGDNVDNEAFYPCNYKLTNIICVGATNQNDQLASFSNFGAANVDIAAPGVNILGIYRGDYLYGNGTSFAAPFVSAAAGMTYLNNPSLSPSQVKNIVLTQSDSIGALNGKIAGARRLNYAKVLGAQIPDVSQPTNPSEQNTYRFYSPVYQGHFFTTSVAERDSLITSDPNWNYEGVAFKTYKSTINSQVKPVFRFYSNNFRAHFYTISEGERDLLINNDPNWNYEGISYYASRVINSDVQPLYRFYSPVYRNHFFTVSQGERDSLIANDPNWSFEGIAYYLPK